MNKDLNAQLDELGGEYRTLVNAMVGACEAPSRHWHSRRFVGCLVGSLAAASLALALVLSAVFRSEPEKLYTVRATSAANEYLLATARDDAAIREIIRTQNADGSWKNDFLTRQNAAALKNCHSKEAQTAYKKAMRNLRSKGVL